MKCDSRAQVANVFIDHSSTSCIIGWPSDLIPCSTRLTSPSKMILTSPRTRRLSRT